MTPAIALIDTLSGDSTIEIVFVGRKYAMEGDRNVSAEYELMREKGIRFLPIMAGRMQRAFTVQTIPSLIKVPVGLIQALSYCVREKPHLIVSFGGYVALPVAIAAWIMGIPVITHEQTLAAGLANKVIAMIAKRVCVTFEETRTHFPKGKVAFTGLPMRAQLFELTKEPPYTIDAKKYPLLYITGGSLGARSLNERLFPAIPELLRSYTIIHQTGSVSFEEASGLRQSLPRALRDRYIIEPFIPLPSLAWTLQRAVIVIGRSGANTTIELASLGKVAILVPLPWSAGNEQLWLARWLSSHGAAEVIIQDTLTSEVLMDTITKIRNDYESLSSQAKTLSRHIPRDGAKRMMKEIREVLSSSV